MNKTIWTSKVSENEYQAYRSDHPDIISTSDTQDGAVELLGKMLKPLDDSEKEKNSIGSLIFERFPQVSDWWFWVVATDTQFNRIAKVLMKKVFVDLKREVELYYMPRQEKEANEVLNYLSQFKCFTVVKKEGENGIYITVKW